jgi:hypothetical protein
MNAPVPASVKVVRIGCGCGEWTAPQIMDLTIECP